MQAYVLLILHSSQPCTRTTHELACHPTCIAICTCLEGYSLPHWLKYYDYRATTSQSLTTAVFCVYVCVHRLDTRLSEAILEVNFRNCGELPLT